MPSPKKPGARAPQKHELDAFIERYDTLSDIYGDPVQKVFEIMASSSDEDTQLAAANTLLSYRFPRLKAAEGAGGPNAGPAASINIFLNGRPGPESETVREINLPPAKEPVTLKLPENSKVDP